MIKRTILSKWEAAIKDEMKSMIFNKTWELAVLPRGKKSLHNKWVYRIKEDHDGFKRYKARLVVKGFQQKEEVNYTKTFDTVVMLNTVRSLLSIVANKSLYLEQLNAKISFLDGNLIVEIYMHQTEEFTKERKKAYGAQTKEGLVWSKTSSKIVVYEV